MSVTPSLCVDCGVDTTPCLRRRGCRHADSWEYYMVLPEVWRQAWDGDPKLVVDQFGYAEGFLCIGCLEKRLGRKLDSSDFTDAMVNHAGDPWNTPRLREALLRRPER